MRRVGCAEREGNVRKYVRGCAPWIPDRLLCFGSSAIGRYHARLLYRAACIRYPLSRVWCHRQRCCPFAGRVGDGDDHECRRPGGLRLVCRVRRVLGRGNRCAASAAALGSEMDSVERPRVATQPAGRVVVACRRELVRRGELDGSSNLLEVQYPRVSRWVSHMGDHRFDLFLSGGPFGFAGRAAADGMPELRKYLAELTVAADAPRYPGALRDLRRRPGVVRRKRGVRAEDEDEIRDAATA
jgi:hypothetical protein